MSFLICAHFKLNSALVLKLFLKFLCKYTNSADFHVAPVLQVLTVG